MELVIILIPVVVMFLICGTPLKPWSLPVCSANRCGPSRPSSSYFGPLVPLAAPLLPVFSNEQNRNFVAGTSPPPRSFVRLNVHRCLDRSMVLPPVAKNKLIRAELLYYASFMLRSQICAWKLFPRILHEHL